MPAMAQVVIAGCGYVGNRLAEMLLAEGHEVFGIRRDISALAPGVRGIRGQRRDAERPRSCPRRASNTRSSRLEPTRGRKKPIARPISTGLAGFLQWLLDEGQRPRRIIMTSSTSVYGQRRGEPINEDSPTHPTQFRGGKRCSPRKACWRRVEFQASLFALAESTARIERVLIRRAREGSAPTPRDRALHESDSS